MSQTTHKSRVDFAQDERMITAMKKLSEMIEKLCKLIEESFRKR